MSWLELNNQVIIRDNNGKYQLEKDKEALASYIENYVNKRAKSFNNIVDKINYLIENNYYDKEVINKYDKKFIENLYNNIKSENFKFQSYMAANKFYQSYALKSNDGKEILEMYEDKVLIVALTLGNGDTNLALDIANKLIKQEFQPATPTFLNAGRARGGEMVSCFLINVEDSCEGISYAISSA
ncbi:MAG: ribonucleotide-diphosphate reductase subunit alpha, partial [Peptostreptococcaceae bacterium]|nr:ribonucleotide-diphosphate reductase subunit alpha [Peptostreptococcaceae bacterium]